MTSSTKLYPFFLKFDDFSLLKRITVQKKTLIASRMSLENAMGIQTNEVMHAIILATSILLMRAVDLESILEARQLLPRRGATDGKCNITANCNISTSSLRDLFYMFRIIYSYQHREIGTFKDAFRYVLFEDIKGCIFPLAGLPAKKFLIYNLLNLMSISLNSGLSSNFSVLQDGVLAPELSNSFMNKNLRSSDIRGDDCPKSFFSPKETLHELTYPPFSNVPQTSFNVASRICGWPGLISDDLVSHRASSELEEDTLSNRRIQKIDIARCVSMLYALSCDLTLAIKGILCCSVRTFLTKMTSFQACYKDLGFYAQTI